MNVRITARMNVRINVRITAWINVWITAWIRIGNMSALADPDPAPGLASEN